MYEHSLSLFKHHALQIALLSLSQKHQLSVYRKKKPKGKTNKQKGKYKQAKKTGWLFESRLWLAATLKTE